MNETVNLTEQSKPADTRIFSLLHAAHALEAKVEEALERADLSSPKYSVLSALVEAGEPVSLSQLASQLSCVRSNMTQLVDRLEAEGLVRRVDHPADRRSVKASITAQGRERQAAGAEQIAELHREFAQHVDPKDHAAVGRLLSALR